MSGYPGTLPLGRSNRRRGLLYRTPICLLFLWALVSPAQDPKPNPPAAQSHPDFSGTWEVVEPQRTFPGSENRTASYRRYSDAETDQIDHAEPVLAITPRIGHVDVVYTLFCRTDGKGPQGPYASRQTRCDGHWEGRNYVFQTSSPHGGAALSTTTLSLSDDGKRMTKVVRTSGPNGTTEQTLIFEKVSAARGGIAIGDTIERVKYQWGEPEKAIEEGRQTILIYGDFDNVFIDGKMVDGAGTPLRDKPPVYPDNIAIGQTRDQVVKVYGQPTKTIQRNGKEIDFYGSLAVGYSGGNLVYISATGQTKDEILAVFGQPTRTVEWKGKEFGFYPFMTATYFNNKLITIGPSSY